MGSIETHAKYDIIDESNFAKKKSNILHININLIHENIKALGLHHHADGPKSSKPGGKKLMSQKTFGLKKFSRNSMGMIIMDEGQADQLHEAAENARIEKQEAEKHKKQNRSKENAKSKDSEAPW